MDIYYMTMRRKKEATLPIADPPKKCVLLICRYELQRSRVSSFIVYRQGGVGHEININQRYYLSSKFHFLLNIDINSTKHTSRIVTKNMISPEECTGSEDRSKTMLHRSFSK